MKRLDVLRAAPLGLLAACSGGSVSNLLAPATSRLTPGSGSGGSGSGCQVSYNPKSNILRLNDCDNGISGYASMPIDPKTGQWWDELNMEKWRGSQLIMDASIPGPTIDKRWGEKQLFKFFNGNDHDWWFNPHPKGGLLLQGPNASNLVPLVDNYMYASENKFVANVYTDSKGSQYTQYTAPLQPGGSDKRLPSGLFLPDDCADDLTAYYGAVISVAIMAVFVGLGWPEALVLLIAVAVTDLKARRDGCL